MGTALRTDEDEDVVCPRCGERAEAGFLAAMGTISWSTGGSGSRWTAWGDEKLANSWTTPRVRIAAHRCRRCRFAWFEL
jgi:hypothetical protein